jgi:ATP-dependent DNA ligase
MVKPQKVLHLHLEEAKKKPKITGRYIVTEKLDGWYGYIDYVQGEWGKVTSSSGREIPSLLWARQVFQELTPESDIRLIFEIVIPDQPFHILNGILNRSVGNCQATDARFYIHDMVDFKYPNEALTRTIFLKGLDLSEVDKYIHLVPVLAITDDKEVWMKHFKEITDRGGEGIILKQALGLYQADKRNSSLMKVKLESTFDLECFDMFHTVGERGHDNLNISLRRKNGAVITVRIPKDEDRELFELNPNAILGKVVEVKCMCELEDGMLREPRFMRVRDDKLLEDID